MLLDGLLDLLGIQIIKPKEQKQVRVASSSAWKFGKVGMDMQKTNASLVFGGMGSTGGIFDGIGVDAGGSKELTKKEAKARAKAKAKHIAQSKHGNKELAK